MSKQCAQVVHDSGGVYGLTQQAQKQKDREVARQKEALVKKSKQIHSLQISASNYKISKEKWKQAFVAQREKGQAQLVEATARLRTKYAARIAPTLRQPLALLVGWLWLARWFVFGGQGSASGALARSRR